MERVEAIDEQAVARLAAEVHVPEWHARLLPEDKTALAKRMIIGGAVLTNGNPASCDLVIENETPILRQKDILTEERADSPCRRIYYASQLMYIDEANLAKYHKLYWDLVGEVVQTAPSRSP